MMGFQEIPNNFVINSITIFNYYVEMLLSSTIVASSLKPAKWYFAKLTVTAFFSAAIWFVVMFILPATHFTYEYLRYFVLFLTCLAGIYFCYDITLGKALFCGVALYAIQHSVCKAYTLLFYLIDSSRNTTWEDVPHFIAYWCILAILYFTLYLLLGKRLKISQAEFSTKVQVITVITLLIVTLFISATYKLSDSSATNNIIFLLCDGLCATLLLINQLHTYRFSQKELEMAEAESLHRMELHQMRQTKELMDLINIKSHDLKHQLIAMQNKLNEDEAEEIAKAVYTYDSSINTGSEALNLVVSQKKMICDRENILLTCMLDGKSLAFMNDVHIYSLVGNLLDNAIEAVKMLPKDRRYIVFEVKQTANTLLLRAENEYGGKLCWKDGMLLTSKGDKNYHGFGIKSVASIVQKYDGIMNISATDGLFVLTVSFANKDPA